MLVQHFELHGRHLQMSVVIIIIKHPLIHQPTHSLTHPLTCRWAVKQYNADQVKGTQSVSVAVQFTLERLPAGHKAKDITPPITWKEEVPDSLP